MRTRAKVLALGAVLVLAAGCASARPLRLQARDDFEKGDFAAAEQKLVSDEVLGEKKSRFVTWVDLGMVAHGRGEYQKSLLFFEKAKELSVRLYTESLSEGAATFVYNDKAKSYPGLDYEVSKIHYYLVLNHLLIAQAGVTPEWTMPEIRDGQDLLFEPGVREPKALSPMEVAAFRRRAQAEVLAWDSYLETLRGKYLGEPVYKDDIAAKLLAAYVHRMADNKTDQGVAKNLYRHAQQLLLRSAALLPSFNKNSAEFVERYSELHKLPEEQVRERLVEATEPYRQLERMVGELPAKVGVKESSTLVILEAGIIPEKREKAHDIGLGALINEIEDPGVRRAVTEIGIHALFHFAPIVLLSGAIEAAGSSSEDPTDGLNRGVDQAVGFKFKLPYIPMVRNDVEFKLVLTSQDVMLGAKATRIEVPLVLVDSLSDTAWNEVEQKSSAVTLKTGLRVGTKYLAALIPAYWAYTNSLKNMKSEWLAAATAMLVWIGAKKAVDATEGADTRAWNTLPQGVFMAEVPLPSGHYAVKGVGRRGDHTWEEELGEATVGSSKFNLIKKRLMRFAQPSGATGARYPESRASGSSASELLVAIEPVVRPDPSKTLEQR